MMQMKRSEFLRAKLFIFTDVEREIQLAKANRASLRGLGINPGGGNFLAALGLLCYTEFGGKLRFGHKNAQGRDIASKNFHDFFDLLGTDYVKLQSICNVYDIFRCGLAHEFYVKQNCAIHMESKQGRSGIWQTPRGKYKISIQTYCRDLKAAFETLQLHLFGK
jgi:hypothetical protein